MEIESPDRMEMSGRRQYHVGCAPGEVARYLLIPGDPGRVPRIADLWDEAMEVAYNREYRTFTGKIGGVPVSATSSGIGSPSTAIAVEELAAIGVDTFIRVGSTGVIQEGIEIGDVVISSGAIRLDGTSKMYVRPEYPAAPHYEVVLALVSAAEELGYRYHVGITASVDSFYTGEGRPGLGGYTQSFVSDIIPDLRAARVLNFDMESGTLFTLANLFGLRAGTICGVGTQRVKGESVLGGGEKESIAVANEAVKILAAMDAAKARRQQRYWHLGLGT